MVMNLEEFRKCMTATSRQREIEMYRLADLEVNGSEEHYRTWSQELVYHPIRRHGASH